ncbi:MAG TPA: GNAT family N-acetyltransferase [Terriglobales bacterium]|nr:GNAT family N-acetyltransferase [Terriglobales bacterium]
MPALGLQARLFTDVNQISSLRHEWDDLFRRCPGATTFQRPQWILSWFHVFRPARPFVVAVWHESLLVGLAPLLIYNRDSQSVLAFAGGGVSDYLDVLIDPAHASEVWDAILEAIGSHRRSWDRVELTDLPQASIALQKNRTFHLEIHDTCPVLELPSSVGLMGSVIPAHKLRNYRNARRRLGEAGPFRIEIATAANLEESLSTLFRLHSDRWNRAGHRGVLLQDEVRRFHHEIAPQLVAAGILRLYLLRLNDTTLATLYAFFEHDVVYCYLQGFDPEYSKLSPGTFILGAVIEDAIRHRAGKIDFLRGRESYKYSWGAHDHPTYCLTQRPDSA